MDSSGVRNMGPVAARGSRAIKSAATHKHDTIEQPLEHEIDPGIQEELLKHPGKWVAITRSRVLAVGDDVMTVLREARKLGVEEPIIFRVPNDDGAAYFF